MTYGTVRGSAIDVIRNGTLQTGGSLAGAVAGVSDTTRLDQEPQTVTTVNALNPRVDITARVFENFYGESLQVPANEYDVVNSFFRRAMTSTEAADNFTVQVFRIAAISETPSQTILARLQDQDEVQLTATLSYLLNGVRSPTTLLGINEISTPNVWAARNVRP